MEEEIQDLINYCHSCAKKLLIENSEFYPFGAVIENNGTLTPTSVHDGDEFPLSQTVIDNLTRIFQEYREQGKIRCSCITYDVRIRTDDSGLIDAILMKIEHIDLNEIHNYYFPYRFLGNSKIEFLESWGEIEKNEPSS